MDTNPTQTSYDRVAEEYACRMLHELDHKPRDRELLDQFAAQVKDHGRVADIGCGPGQIARYLHDRGVDAFGIDLSPAMVELARKAHPGMEFQQGNMSALPLPDDSMAGLTTFYSIIHIPRADVVDVLKEMCRVLKKDGTLLLSFHRGDEIRHFEELWEKPVSLDFIFFERDEMVSYLEAASFIIDEVIERAPYPEGVEAQTQRLYIFAHK
jgi:ubiquinone/menaquinone biosynthesis C-methylase UbiE